MVDTYKKCTLLGYFTTTLSEGRNYIVIGQCFCQKIVDIMRSKLAVRTLSGRFLYSTGRCFLLFLVNGRNFTGEITVA